MAVPALRDRRSRELDRPGVTAWDPVAELERTAERFHRLLGQTLDAGWASPWFDDTAFRPPADLEESDDAYVVEVELPGVAKGDVDVEVSGRRLTVTGERKERERSGVLRRRTRTTGRFLHEVVVPGDIDTDGVSAELRDGVLTVTAPKAAADRAERHRVPVV